MINDVAPGPMTQQALRDPYTSRGSGKFLALADRISGPKLAVPEAELSYIPAMVLRRLRALPIAWDG